MTAIKDAAAEFLGHKRVAVTGVSRSAGNHGGNVVYKRLRDRGYDVFAVKPNADAVEGDPAAWRHPPGVKPLVKEFHVPEVPSALQSAPPR